MFSKEYNNLCLILVLFLFWFLSYSGKWSASNDDGFLKIQQKSGPLIEKNKTPNKRVDLNKSITLLLHFLSRMLNHVGYVVTWVTWAEFLRGLRGSKLFFAWVKTFCVSQIFMRGSKTYFCVGSKFFAFVDCFYKMSCVHQFFLWWVLRF